MNLFYKLNLIIVALIATSVSATELQSLDKIEQAAYEYTLKQVQAQYDNPQVVMGTLDTRLRLQACESKLDVFENDSRIMVGNKTVGVKCSSPVAWTVYVPVKIKVFKSVVVASKGLSANHIITKEDLKNKTTDISLLRQGYMENKEQLIGQQLKYAVSMEAVITSMSIRPQKIVRRGELITLVASAGKMEVRVNGTALADAQLGQRVKVKNNSSKRIVEGVVEGPGIVKVIM